VFIYDKAPFPSCHASTLVEVGAGRLLAAWFGGKDEGAKDVQIWLSRFADGKWGPLEVVGTEPGQPCWNPVLFRAGAGKLALWYKAGPSPERWTGFVRWSADDGRSWSTPEMLPAGFYGPVRAKPIRLADGAILAGTSVETYRCWTPFADRSEDGGQTWRRSNAFPGPAGHHQIQPTLVETTPGTVVALMRSRNPLMVCRAVSTDGGRTFSPAEPTRLPNPSAGIDAVRLKSGELWLICNPVPIGRTPVSLYRSADDGKTWTKAKDLETEPGEYSYPAMIGTSDGKLAITYTWRRTHIKYVTVDPAG
jgi:predicted neuraminidase